MDVRPGGFLAGLWNAPQVVFTQAAQFGAFSSIAAAVKDDNECVHQFAHRASLLLTYTRSIFSDTLIFPAYAAGLSLSVLLVQLILRSTPVKKLHARFSGPHATLTDEDEVENSAQNTSGPSPVVDRHVGQLGEPIIFGFRLARLLCCLALLGMYAFTAVRGALDGLSPSVWLQVAACGVYVSPLIHSPEEDLRRFA